VLVFPILIPLKPASIRESIVEGSVSGRISFEYFAMTGIKVVLFFKYFSAR